MADAAVTF